MISNLKLKNNDEQNLIKINKKNKVIINKNKKEYKLFVIFSFLSCSMPIIYCLLSSLVKPDGSQVVMGIGHVIPFFLSFLQISFSISIIMFTKLNNKTSLKEKNSTIPSLIWISIFVGIISSIMYVVSTFLYMYFSNNRPNTQQMLWYGLDFVWFTTPIVLLFPFLTTMIFVNKKYNSSKSILIIIIFFLLSTLLSFVFGILLNLKAIGLALGILISLIISLGILYIDIYKFTCVNIFRCINRFYEVDKSILKLIFLESTTSISLSIFKGVAIICLSIVIPDVINDFVPLSYQMSRVIWFNMMYFIPFIGMGISEEIRYHYISKHSDSQNKCYLIHNNKSDLKIMFITFGLTLIVAISCIFLVKPLNYLYAVNDHNLFKDNLMPEIKGWGIPISTPTEIPNLSDLKNLDLTPLPEFKPVNGNTEQDILNRIENIKLFGEWINTQIVNNKDSIELIKHDFDILNEWFKWLNQTNESGISILQFIEQKNNNVDFMNEIKNIMNGQGISNDFQNAVKELMSYFVYLWLYSSTTDTITDSFLLLRPIINYHNVLTDDNVVQALINNPISNVLTSLFLLINKFEAKSMIYVAIYGVLNSVWSILIQVNQRNTNRSMPYWLLIIVYIICVGGLVLFGVLFAVAFKDQLGTNNPFMYLDAWTFPLVFISLIVIIVLSIKYYLSYKRLKNKLFF
ncbi:MAG: hypothetical protein HDR43_01875 [Mycoplasma sp.]|nr:hypothetical protein [Mycoplasma sp.]